MNVLVVSVLYDNATRREKSKFMNENVFST